MVSKRQELHQTGNHAARDDLQSQIGAEKGRWQVRKKQGGGGGRFTNLRNRRVALDRQQLAKVRRGLELFLRIIGPDHIQPLRNLLQALLKVVVQRTSI
jgi:hypothetical protein